MTDMKQLTREQRVAVIRCLVEGVSIRATTRITGVAKNTIQKLTRDLGEAVLEYQDNVLRNLKCKRIECDEIWAFCYAKDKNLPDSMRGEPGVGSIWTWTALCADSKLMVSWQLGARDAANAHAFIRDVSERLADRVQLTTDGNRVYLDAVEHYLGGKVDYAMLVKQYGEEKSPERTYSPAKCLGTKRRKIDGDPDMAKVSTSYAERQNLNIRMGNRRYTRLTNAFSKKAEMLAYSVAISFMYHNFVRVHQNLKTTPAIAAGVAKVRWTLEDVVDLLPILSYNTRPKKSAGLDCPTTGRCINASGSSCRSRIRSSWMLPAGRPWAETIAPADSDRIGIRTSLRSFRRASRCPSCMSRRRRIPSGLAAWVAASRSVETRGRSWPRQQLEHGSRRSRPGQPRAMRGSRRANARVSWFVPLFCDVLAEQSTPLFTQWRRIVPLTGTPETLAALLYVLRESRPVCIAADPVYVMAE